jgi:hypothetical protein
MMVELAAIVNTAHTNWAQAVSSAVPTMRV